MGQRRVAARLWTLTLAALLLGAAPASRLGSLDLAPSQLSERAEVLGSLPFGEGMVLSSARLFVSESSGIERSQPLFVASGLVALCTLLAVGVSWRSSLLGRRRWTLLSPLRHLAGPRAPPLQLA